jgi:hypothetical protein
VFLKRTSVPTAAVAVAAGRIVGTTLIFAASENNRQDPAVIDSPYAHLGAHDKIADLEARVAELESKEQSGGNNQDKLAPDGQRNKVSGLSRKDCCADKHLVSRTMRSICQAFLFFSALCA